MESLKVVKRLRKSQNAMKPKTIVVTGCSSGIGLYACKIMKIASPESRIFLVARNWEKACYTRDFVLSISEHGNVDNIIPMVCDHSSLKSVYAFCDELKNKLKDIEASDPCHERIGIDVLCLNAAVLLGEDEGPIMTEDGMELTFQTNHLAPFLIGNILSDIVNPGGRIVVTTSGLQQYASFNNFEGIIDPSTGQFMKKFTTVDGSDFNSKEAYSLSKLCNVAFALALNRRLACRKIKVTCFTPGLIPKSGLFRHRKKWAETLTSKQALGIDDTEEWGGSFLAWMALSDEAGDTGGTYWRSPLGISKRGGAVPDCLYCDIVNKEASDPNNQELLWQVSSELAGIRSHAKST